ncbi:MAG: thiol-activated cytolysin family protein, partial [bacterium]
MKKISLLGFVVFLMAIMFFYMYCSKDKPTEPSYGEGIDENVKTLDKLLQEPPCDETPIGDPSIDTTTIDNQQYIVKTQKYKRAAEYNEQLALDPTTDVIWPGAMIDAATIPTGQYIPITAKRAPLTLSISLVNIAGIKSKTVAEPKLSTIREAIGEILAQDVTGATEARVTFSIEDVYSEEQLKLAVGASYKSGFGSIKGQFNFSKQEIKTRILVKFMQVYYTIDIDIPEKPSDFFASSVKWDDLQSQITENTSPMYVSTITYGRMALFSFESTDKSTDVNAAVSAAFWGFKGSISTEYENILKSSTIKATIIGGSGASAVGAINGFEGIKEYILTGGDYDKNTAAAPLSYKLRHLKDNAIGNIILSSEYTIREEIPLGPLSNYELFWYRADANVTLDGNHVANWGNSFRKGINDASGNACFQWNPDHSNNFYIAPVINPNSTYG